jgi:hypothetical protein
MSLFYDNAQKSIVYAVIKDLTTGMLLVLPPPSGGQFETGIELTAIEAVNCEGITSTVKRFQAKQDPKVSLTFGAKTPDVVCLALGRKLQANASGTSQMDASSFQVPSDGLVPAVTTGTMGFGIAANAVATASWQNAEGVSEALVQDPTFATFDPAAVGSTKKFAIGANGEMKFGNELRGRRISMEIPYSITNVYNLGSAYNNLAIRVGVIDIALRQWQWIFPSVSIEPGSINLVEPEQESSFFVNGGYDLRFMRQLHPCRDRVA